MAVAARSGGANEADNESDRPEPFHTVGDHVIGLLDRELALEILG